ncbi:hypothetical protein WJX73_010348 [Symbiochloris irregularis]|uniref:V-type proton ATPase subunit H n=1 Tax=Symbiochloris irregularis TaxID=706552 RepID=A0AAW1PYU7_9CHLO
MSQRTYDDDARQPTTASLLRRDVPWQTYLTARLISDRDLQLIRAYDKRDWDTKREALKQAGPAHLQAFLTVLRNVTKEDTVQYVLALLDDTLTEQPSAAALFHEQSNSYANNQIDPYTIFLRLLQRTDWFTQEKACKLLAAIIVARPNKVVKEEVAQENGHGPADSASTSQGGSSEAEGVQTQLAGFVEWLCSQLRRPSHPGRSVPTAVAALSQLLRERPARALVYKAGGVQLLAPLIRAGNNFATGNNQLLYEVGLCAWQLSYHQPAAEAMGPASYVPGLVEIVRSAAKEKVVRVATLALSHLLEQDNLDLGPDMVEAGLPKAVAMRKAQPWEDEELKAALDFLESQLAVSLKLLSSFERYKKEVLSGSLDWAPLHTSPQFWKDNAQALTDKDHQLLRVLLKLLESSRSVKTLAVGCNDLGQFITYHPSGRQIVTDLKGKELVMRLMMNSDPEVQKQALLCVQKIMLAKDKAQFLAGESEA